MGKSISDLPWDLIEEILSRVPITSLRDVASTCKRWNTLSKDHIFRKKHCRKAAAKEEFLLNVTYDDGHGPSDFSPVRFNLQSTKELLPSSGKKIGTFLTPVKIFGVYQCNGLFLLHTMVGLVVWNPYLGHTRWIQPRISDLFNNTYAVGYDNKKNHKVLKIRKEKHEIYDFNSNSWRVLEFTCGHFFKTCAASLKGNTYFVTWDETRIWSIPDERRFVICFDFTTERFGPRLQLPFDSFREDVILSCIREEQLAVFAHRCSVATSEMDIWITTTIEPNAVSWSKFLKVEIPIDRSSYFLSYIKVLSFFIDKEKKAVVVCGRDSHSFDYDITSVIVGEDGFFKKTVLANVFSYVPSLVQIQ